MEGLVNKGQKQKGKNLNRITSIVSYPASHTPPFWWNIWSHWRHGALPSRASWRATVAWWWCWWQSSSRAADSDSGPSFWTRSAAEETHNFQFYELNVVNVWKPKELINTTHTVSAKTFNTSQTFAFWSFGTSHILNHNDFFFPRLPTNTPLF